MYGQRWTPDDAMAMGKEVLKLERAFNEAAGFNKADDRLPEFMDREKLPPHNVIYGVPDEVLDSVYNF